jgi:hypothetical protein
LNISECSQLITTESLKGIVWLNMSGHSEEDVYDAESLDLNPIEVDDYGGFGE